MPYSPWVYVPRHAIYLIPNKNPKLFRIAERGTFLAWLDTQNNGLKQVYNKIIRIKHDSIFLLDAKYRLNDFYKIHLAGFKTYFPKDSAEWKIIFPPDSIYNSRSEFWYYIYALECRVKKENQDWRCAPFYHNLFKLNFSLIANLTIAISWEHRFNHAYAIDVEAGYQFQGIPGDAGSPMDENLFPIWKQSGVIANVGFKYYFDKKGYLEPVLIYKYLAMSQALTGFPTGQWEWLQDAYTSHYGIALRVGTMTRFGGMILDGYFGLGVRVMMIHQLIYGSWDDNDERVIYLNPDHSANVYNLVQYYPVVNLGIKLGFGF